MKDERKLLTDADKKQMESILKGELSRRREIIFAYLHGSFILPIPCGDIDIAVYLEKTLLPRKHWEYEAELSVALERLAGMSVDVMVLNNAPVALRYHVTRGKVLLSRNEYIRFDFMEQTWHEYFDYQPLLRAYLDDLLTTPTGQNSKSRTR